MFKILILYDLFLNIISKKFSCNFKKNVIVIFIIYFNKFINKNKLINNLIL